jgi:hypothetical protein
MRSHAHALRSAQRNKSRPPPLVCTYAEGEDEEMVSPPEAERKRVSSATMTNGAKRAAVGGDRLHREKELRAVEEKDTLRARIAELEARIAALTTDGYPRSVPAHISPASSGSGSGASPDSIGLGAAKRPARLPEGWDLPMNAFPIQTQPIIVSEPSAVPPLVTIEAGAPGQFQAFDFSNLLMLPAKWPKNLPSPAILEHLIETFFQYEPQTPRMIHRPTLLMRVRLPPTHPDFPFPGLLHAICSAAAPHTAWIHNPRPEEVEEMSMRAIEQGLDLEDGQDFALAQAEAAERCIRHTTTMCMMGTGKYMFDLSRAQMILSVVYFNRGMGLRSWLTSGGPVRLVKALEILNRNTRKADKPALIGDPTYDYEREERRATVWLSYLQETGFAANSNWAPNFDLDEIHTELPTTTDEFTQKHDSTGFMKPNPQTGRDIDVLVNHPMPDPFVLVIQCSIILGRVSKWIRMWQQRHIRPGDNMEGFRSPEFVKLNAEIAGFQLSIPSGLKNIYKMADTGQTGAFTADLLSIHLLPNLATVLLHEQFVDWKGPESPSHRQMQKAFEAVVGFIHLIPSQLDITLMLNPLLVFSLFTIGKTINRFIIRAHEMEQYAHAMRWRTDLMAINNVLTRYGAKHLLGLFLAKYSTSFQKLFEAGYLELECGADPCKLASDLTESTEPSLSSTYPPSTAGSTSLGHSPDSIEVVDAQARGNAAQAAMPPGGLETLLANGMPIDAAGLDLEALGFGAVTAGAAAPGATGAAGAPSFDPSLLDLEFLDPATAAQLVASMCAGTGPGTTSPGAGAHTGTGTGTGLSPLGGMGMDADPNTSFVDLLATVGAGADRKSPASASPMAWTQNNAM